MGWGSDLDAFARKVLAQALTGAQEQHFDTAFLPAQIPCDVSDGTDIPIALQENGQRLSLLRWQFFN